MRARVVTNRMTKGGGKKYRQRPAVLATAMSVPQGSKRVSVTWQLGVQYCSKLSLPQGLDFMFVSPSYPAG